MKEKDRLNNFTELVSEKPSKFLEKFNNFKANKKNLDRSAEIAITILDLLRERKWTQKDLAQKMNVSPQQINKLVKGSENITFETVDKLEDAFGCKLMSIMNYSKVLNDNTKLTSEIEISNPLPAIENCEKRSTMVIVHRSPDIEVKETIDIKEQEDLLEM